MLTHGSLFSGIGGFDLGFERAGITTVWQVELDPYAQRVLARHFPEAQRYGDIRECGRHNLAPVDILSGGFPCQDISNAGKRAGIEGERSGLWSEYARIVGELRPRFVVVENVAALLGRGMGRVLGDLAACGYDAEWQSIRASDVGAPHRRERIWIVAYPGREQQGSRRKAWERRPERSQSESNGASWRAIALAANLYRRANGRSYVADAEQPGLEGYAGNGEGRTEQKEQNGSTCEASLFNSMRKGFRFFETSDAWSECESGRNAISGSSWWLIEPNVGRVAHGVPARVDRLKGLGNSIVPQIAEWIGRRLVEAANE